jgi:eukaryotic-like serine/threonine-protein kinase
MSTPASHYAEDESSRENDAWPEPRRGSPIRPAPQPRRRRQPADFVWAVLAAMGLALGAVAVVWYLSLNRSSPPAQLTVPRVVGMKEAAAVRRLTTEGFNVRAIERPADAKPGHVFQQRPEPLTTLDRGATVTIRVAARPDR